MARLCIDCRYIGTPGEPLCARPVSAARSRVDGSPARRLMVRCDVERHGNRTMTGRLKCGAEARFFAPRRPLSPPQHQGSGGRR